MGKFGNLEESYQGLDHVGDFISSKFLLRCFGYYWNEVSSESKIKVQGFSLENITHVDFIRTVLSSKDSRKDFLLELKHQFGVYGLRNKISDQEIICFLLAWINSAERVETGTESLGTIFSTPTNTLIDEVGNREYDIITGHDDESTPKYAILYDGLKHLVEHQFHPINEEGNILCGAFETTPVYSYTQAVVLTSQRLCSIGKDGRELSDDEVEQIETDEIPELITTLQATLSYIEGGGKWQNIDDELLPILEEILSSVEAESISSNLIIEQLNIRIEAAKKELRSHSLNKFSVVGNK